MKNKYSQELKYKALLSLQIYSEKSIILKAKGFRVQKLHKFKVFKKNFTAWQTLFKYYSEVMKESMAK